MAKKNNNNNTGKAKGRKRGSAQPARQNNATRNNAVASVDAGARSFARMLADPCNAPMGPPVYTGMGTGEYRRMRRVFTIPATAVEGTYTFQPSTNTMLIGTHILANAGTNYTMNGADIFTAGVLTARAEVRCLGACVKIRYTGAEQSRAGVMALQTGPTEHLRAGDIRTAAQMQSIAPVLARLGEVLHEVKFTPGTGDEGFSNVNTGGPYVTGRDQGSMTFTFSGIPAGTLQVEVTAILEVEAGESAVASSVAPNSRNTLNQVLQALGPTARWAYGNYALPVMRSMAANAPQALFNTASFGARLALM